MSRQAYKPEVQLNSRKTLGGPEKRFLVHNSCGMGISYFYFILFIYFYKPFEQFFFFFFFIYIYLP